MAAHRRGGLVAHYSLQKRVTPRTGRLADQHAQHEMTLDGSLGIGMTALGRARVELGIRGVQDVVRGCAYSRYLLDVLDVGKWGVDGCPCAGAKRISNPASLITSEVNTVGPERKSDIRIEIVRLHGEQVLAGHGGEVDRSNHDLSLPRRGYHQTPQL